MSEPEKGECLALGSGRFTPGGTAPQMPIEQQTLLAPEQF
jgi:hypothetical protein